MTESPGPILLLHGAWHGAWCWSSLQHELDQRGLPSYALDLPGRGTSAEEPNGLQGDAHALVQALDQITTAAGTVVVAHSYGGAVAGEVVAERDDVTHLVYVAALALTAGESVNGFLRSAPRHRVGLADHMRPMDDGSIELDRSTAAAIYGDLPAATAAAHTARLTVQPAGTFTDETTQDPFGRVPNTYVMCERDDAVHPVHQEMLSDRCDHAVRLASDHFPMLHMPGVLADVIEPLARKPR